MECSSYVMDINFISKSLFDSSSLILVGSGAAPIVKMRREREFQLLDFVSEKK